MSTRETDTPEMIAALAVVRQIDQHFEGSERLRLGKWVAPDERERTIAGYIALALTKAIADEQKRCWKIAHERAAFNRRMAQTFKIGDPMADLKHTRADEGDIIANEIAVIRRDSTGEEGS